MAHSGSGEDAEDEEDAGAEDEEEEDEEQEDAEAEEEEEEEEEDDAASVSVSSDGSFTACIYFCGRYLRNSRQKPALKNCGACGDLAMAQIKRRNDPANVSGSSASASD